MTVRGGAWLFAALGAAALCLLHGTSTFMATGLQPRGSSSLRGAAALAALEEAGVRSQEQRLPSSSWMALPLVGAACAGAALCRGGLKRSRQNLRNGRPWARQVTTRTEWYRKVKRVGSDKAIFDVTIPKPLGVAMQVFPNPKRAGVGISEVVEGGNTDKLNKRVCVDDEPGSGMWVLEGDQVLAVNGQSVEKAQKLSEVVDLVMEAEQEVTLTLLRNTRLGPIKIVMMPEGFSMTVRRNSRLSAAAEAAAGRELKYGCIDGWCGTCWHRERTTNGIFKPCCDVITGDWDNVMPLVITPKPERAGDSTLLNPRGV